MQLGGNSKRPVGGNYYNSSATSTNNTNSQRVSNYPYIDKNKLQTPLNKSNRSKKNGSSKEFPQIKLRYINQNQQNSLIDNSSSSTGTNINSRFIGIDQITNNPTASLLQQRQVNQQKKFNPEVYARKYSKNSINAINQSQLYASKRSADLIQGLLPRVNSQDEQKLWQGQNTLTGFDLQNKDFKTYILEYLQKKHNKRATQLNKQNKFAKQSYQITPQSSQKNLQTVIKRMDDGLKSYGAKNGSTTINYSQHHYNNSRKNNPSKSKQQQVFRERKFDDRTIVVGSNGILQGFVPKKPSGLINNISNSNKISYNYNSNLKNLNMRSKQRLGNLSPSKRIQNSVQTIQQQYNTNSKISNKSQSRSPIRTTMMVDNGCLGVGGEIGGVRQGGVGEGGGGQNSHRFSINIKSFKKG